MRKLGFLVAAALATGVLAADVFLAVPGQQRVLWRVRPQQATSLTLTNTINKLWEPKALVVHVSGSDTNSKLLAVDVLRDVAEYQYGEVVQTNGSIVYTNYAILTNVSVSVTTTRLASASYTFGEVHIPVTNCVYLLYNDRLALTLGSSNVEEVTIYGNIQP